MSIDPDEYPLDMGWGCDGHVWVYSHTQEYEGFEGEAVYLDIYRCAVCGTTKAVSHGGDPNDE